MNNTDKVIATREAKISALKVQLDEEMALLAYFKDLRSRQDE